jgi:hypothetical protein
MEGETVSYYLSYLRDFSGPVAVLALLEVIRGFVVRSKPVILLSVFPVIYSLFISQFIVRNDRTLLPMTPFMFILGASFLVNLRTMRTRLPVLPARALSVAVAALALVAIFIPFQAMLADSNLRLTGIENRETARQWIDGNLQAGSRIAVETYSVLPDEKRFSVQVMYTMIQNTPQWYVANGFDYLVFGHFFDRRYTDDPAGYPDESRQFQALFDAGQEIKVFPHWDYEIDIYKLKK